MPSFFIDRPIFAWVVALFICLIGAISIRCWRSRSTDHRAALDLDLDQLSRRVAGKPLQQRHAPDRGGTQRRLGILNFESTSIAGPGRNHRQLRAGHRNRRASVEVQNRLKRVEARLRAR